MRCAGKPRFHAFSAHYPRIGDLPGPETRNVPRAYAEGMTVVALDDTDSRERGMCTTYAAHLVAERLRERGATVERLLLVRLNPAVEYKTRGNAALAVHVDVDPAVAFDVATDVVGANAETADPRTNPGVVVAHERDAPTLSPSSPGGRCANTSTPVRPTRWRPPTATRLRAGATAAVSSGRSRRWAPGRPSTTGRTSTSTTANPSAGDRAPRRRRQRLHGRRRRLPGRLGHRRPREGETVCVPHTPGPILYGIRGDDLETVAWVADEIDSEPVHASQLFVTNQGTDAHLADADLADVKDGRAYRVDVTVGATRDPPRRPRLRARRGRRGARAVCGLRTHEALPRPGAGAPIGRLPHGLRRGERRHVQTGEVRGPRPRDHRARDADLPDLREPDGERGRRPGLPLSRLRHRRPRQGPRPLDRDLAVGWYEVPPCARRHVARPLVRGEWDAPVHPER